MTKNMRRNLGMILLSLFVFTLISIPVYAQGYDIVYEDPEGDVTDTDGIAYPTGSESIDILLVNSSQSTLGQQLILGMRVTGTIIDSEDIVYSFQIMDGGDVAYIVSYSNGICIGMDLEDSSTDTLVASGSGTDTLEVRMSMGNIRGVSDFDFWGMATELSEDKYITDMAPDIGFNIIDDSLFDEPPILITEPKDGATVSGIKTLSGTTDGTYNMVLVEIQFDTSSEGGWTPATTSDDWGNWSYDWDSTGLSDGEHTLRSRAFNGTDYFYDNITVFIDQNNAVTPPKMDLPAISIGNKYQYMYHYSPPPDDPTQIHLTGTMNYTVVDVKVIEVEGSSFEVFEIQLLGSMNMDFDSFSSFTTNEGIQWLRTSDLAMVKYELRSSVSTSGMGFSTTVETESQMIYEPPQDAYAFPLFIAETWSSEALITSHVTTTIEGGTENETHTYSNAMNFEALHIENVEVSAGTFKAFVIWSAAVSEDGSSGGTPSLFGSAPGYSLEYYSPDVGLPVKEEYYGRNRELYMTLELVSFDEVAHDVDPPQDSDNNEIFWYIFAIIIVVMFIVAAVLVIKRRGKSPGQNRPGQEPGFGGAG